MVTRIQKWGNSQGLRLAKRLLEDAHISVGDDVYVTARDGLIVIAPAGRIRGRHSLTELVSRRHPTTGPGWAQMWFHTPVSTIIRPHGGVPQRQGMTMTAGHTVLAIPGVGGVR